MVPVSRPILKPIDFGIEKQRHVVWEIELKRSDDATFSGSAAEPRLCGNLILLAPVTLQVHRHY